MERSFADNAQSGDVRAVSRAVAILAAFEDHDALGLADLTKAADLPKPTAFRIAATLENSGMLERSPDGLYRLGPRLVSLARIVLSRGLPAVAQPHMRALARTFGHSVNLGVLNGSNVLYLDMLESRHSLRMVTGIGALEPLHATAIGKAIAAALPSEELNSLLASYTLRPLTPATITSRARFEVEIEQVRKRGYAIDDAECQPGARCVGAAIRDRHGVIGGISMSASLEYLPDDDLPLAGAAVRDAANAVSVELGALDAVAPTAGVEPAAATSS